MCTVVQSGVMVVASSVVSCSFTFQPGPICCLVTWHVEAVACNGAPTACCCPCMVVLRLTATALQSCMYQAGPCSLLPGGGGRVCQPVPCSCTGTCFTWAMSNTNHHPHVRVRVSILSWAPQGPTLQVPRWGGTGRWSCHAHSTWLTPAQAHDQHQPSHAGTSHCAC